MSICAQQTQVPASLAIEQFSGQIENSGPVFVAVAYWCDDAWPIASGRDREKVVAAAEKYLEMWPNEFKDGMFVNGHGAEGYNITEVPSV